MGGGQLRTRAERCEKSGQGWIERRLTATLLKFQRSMLRTVIGVIMWHCIIGTHARHIGVGHLANDFCRSCGDEEEDETILYLLCTCPALAQR